MSRLLSGIGDDGTFGGVVGAVLQIGFAPVSVKQGIDPAFSDGILIAIEGIARQAIVRPPRDKLGSFASVQRNHIAVC